MDTTWSEALFRESLQLIAEGVADLVGFEVAAISLLREDGLLEFVAIVADEEVREQIVGRTVPVEAVADQLEVADAWGAFRFVPHERMPMAEEHIAYVPPFEETDDPDYWHPNDVLCAPIYDDAGMMRGLLSVDAPNDRRRPDLAQRERMQRYAAQTRRAILTAVQRHDAERRLRLAAHARAVVRSASSQLGVTELLNQVAPALRDAFDASGLWIETLSNEGLETRMFWLSEDAWTPSPELTDVTRDLARRLWARQRVMVITRDVTRPPDLSATENATIDRSLDSGPGVMFVPLGVADTCVGYLVLSRPADGQAWTAAERETLVDVGHDLGRAVLDARLFARERQIAEELRGLDDYRSGLVRVLAHELKNPLAAIAGHAAVTRERGDVTEQADRSLEAISLAAVRMRSVIDDLLVLSRLTDVEIPEALEPTDIATIVRDVVEANQVLAIESGVTMRYEGPDEGLVVAGSPVDLERAATNLVSNAVKYTEAGGLVDVRLTTTDTTVTMEVTDTGIGIGDDEQDHLFTEFYRCSNARQRNLPGTGLGLSIVRQVAQRHAGEVRVRSRLGKGSTFTLELPRA